MMEILHRECGAANVAYILPMSYKSPFDTAKFHVKGHISKKNDIRNITIGLLGQFWSTSHQILRGAPSKAALLWDNVPGLKECLL